MELPVTLSPPVKAYPAYGFPLSILYARTTASTLGCSASLSRSWGTRRLLLCSKPNTTGCIPQKGLSTTGTACLRNLRRRRNLWTLLTAILSPRAFILGVFNENTYGKPAYRQKDQLNSYMITGFDPIRRTLSLSGAPGRSRIPAMPSHIPFS